MLYESHKLNEKLLERARQLGSLAAELTRTEQRERKRLAKILHDDLQQLIAAAKMSVSMINAQTPDDLTETLAGEATSLLDEAIEESRSLSKNLAPPVLRESGLIDSLKWLCRWVNDKHKLSVTLEAARQAETNLEEIKLLVFESVRELLYNIVKHAGVSEAKVHLSREGEFIKVTVSDEGAGFDPSRFQPGSEPQEGFGLPSIQQRIRLFDGKFDIESRPQKGSKFTITLPLSFEKIAQVKEKDIEY